MTYTTPCSQQTEQGFQNLVQIFLAHPGTDLDEDSLRIISGEDRSERLKDRICGTIRRLFHGIDRDEDLVAAAYYNDDLVMELTKVRTDATEEILSGRIIDTKAGISFDREIVDSEDLIYRLKIMEQQREQKKIKRKMQR